MKKIISLATLLLFVAVLNGCKKNDSAKIPGLSTSPVTEITGISATSGGTIASDGGAAITSRGVCWSTSVNPVTADSKTSDGEGSGQFVSHLTDLTAGTTYHVRAYAVNSAGTAYGDDVTFATTGSAPAAVTGAATNITTGGATLNGTVNANDEPTTISFEYGSSTDYGQTAVATPAVASGSTDTDITASLSGLTAGTSYHFRIKAVNASGTTYGADMVFTTTGLAPTATTSAATAVTSAGATLNGIASANNLATTITFEYGTSTSYGQTVSAIPGQITGSTNFPENAAVTGLTQSTVYHFRIKAVSTAGTTYGNDMTFTTSGAGSQVTDIDGNVYNTVTIGTQVWFKENLKATKYNDGTAIPNLTDNTAWGAATAAAYSDYSNTPSNSSTYGRLYNWYAVASINPKNVCPTGWHVPTDTEWTTLINFLGGEGTAGGKLKETGTTHWLTPNTAATNESGYAAFGGGYRSETGAFGLLGNTGFLWSATEGGATYGWYRYMYYNSGSATRGDMDKHAGLSVRCMKN